MSRHEQAYDILDVIRVIKGVWLLALAVPIVAAALVGLWAFTGSEDGHKPTRVLTVIRFPTGSIETRDIAKQVAEAAAVTGDDRSAFSVVTEELPTDIATYRAIKVSINAQPNVDGRLLLEEAIRNLALSVDQYNSDLNQQRAALDARRDTLERFLVILAEPSSPNQSVVTTAAIAQAAASLVSALRDLEKDASRIAERGGDPLEMVAPIEVVPDESEMAPDLRWLRYPIVAAVGSLLAVLFVAFTLDGIRLATERRHNKA